MLFPALFKKYHTVLLLGGIFFLFLLVRFYDYPRVLNFSTDQALFSLKAREIWQTGKQTLIGPTFSMHVDGRYAFQGPLIYYVQLFYLLLGNWDPIWSSALFTITAAVMIFPLFQGVKNLSNQKTAFLIVCIYSFFPVFLQYSRFLWNPNYQLVFFPIAIWLYGKFKRSSKPIWFFFFSFWLGILLQFHYQFLLVMGGLLIYFFGIKKMPWRWLVPFFVGIAIGFSPLILFEFRHQFYNVQTLLMFGQRMIQGKNSAAADVGIQIHYFLTVSFAAITGLILHFKKKISVHLVQVLSFSLLGWSLLITFAPHPHAFGMPTDWNFLKERQVSQLIQTQKLTHFRVINLIYDTKAAVQTYLLSDSSSAPIFEDYATNEFLFVIGTEEAIQKTQAYEFTRFFPRELVHAWMIDEQRHQLLLYRRVQR